MQKETKMILLPSSKLSLNWFASLSVLSSFLLSNLLTILLSILPSISSLSLFHKSVPRTLVNILFFVHIIHLLILRSSFVDAQLIINLKNRGGEVFQEAISANTTEDVIEVEYQNTDGSLVTQLIDFRNVSIYF